MPQPLCGQCSVLRAWPGSGGLLGSLVLGTCDFLLLSAACIFWLTRPDVGLKSLPARMLKLARFVALAAVQPSLELSLWSGFLFPFHARSQHYLCSPTLQSLHDASLLVHDAWEISVSIIHFILFCR